MKAINIYIVEKLKINKSSNIDDKVSLNICRKNAKKLLNVMVMTNILPGMKMVAFHIVVTIWTIK